MTYNGIIMNKSNRPDEKLRHTKDLQCDDYKKEK